MKRFLSLSIICLMSLFAFAGCGVKGGTLATGIEFVHDVFYVDYDVDTFLELKTYPSTSQNVFINYEAKHDLTQGIHFELKKTGWIRVFSSDFTYITVTASLNEFTDVCEVRLKEYPNSISFKSNEDYVNAGSVYPLELNGVYGEEGEEIVKSCREQQYNYKLTSSDPSIIEIISQEDLLVRSTGRNGEAVISLQICDSLGNEKYGLATSIKLSVVENIASSYITLNKVAIHNKTEMDLSVSNGQELELKALYFGTSNFVNTITSFEVYLSNDQVFEIVKGEGIILKVKNLATTVDDEYHSVKLTIQTGLLDSSGSPHRIDVNLRVRIL